MRVRHDVHVEPGGARCIWTVRQAGHTLSRHRLEGAAVRAARRVAAREHVELVIHGRNGRIRAKDSHGREGTVRDRR